MDSENKYVLVESFLKKMNWTAEELERFLNEVKEWTKDREYRKILREREIFSKVTTLLVELGVSVKLRGVMYVREGIVYVLDNPEVSEDQIYNYLIAKFSSTPVQMKKTVDVNIQKIITSDTTLFEKIFSMPNADYDTHEHFFKSIAKYLREVEKL